VRGGEEEEEGKVWEGRLREKAGHRQSMPFWGGLLLLTELQRRNLDSSTPGRCKSKLPTAKSVSPGAEAMWGWGRFPSYNQRSDRRTNQGFPS
jgi:hypothetical protein